MATAFISDTEALPFIHPEDMPDQYALTAVGTCMAPLIDDGALIVFDTRKELQRGDVVGIVFSKEAALQWGVPGLVKKLAFALPPSGIPGGLIVVDQINPPRRYCISTRDVLAVHKAIGTAESDGEGQAKFYPAKVEAWS